MKKYLKTAIVACIAICMIACVGLFATACADTSKYVITVVSAENDTPVEGVKIQFCSLKSDGSTDLCLSPNSLDYDGNTATVDLAKWELTSSHLFHIEVTNKNYELVTDGFNHNDTGIIVDTEKDGYSITIKVKAVA